MKNYSRILHAAVIVVLSFQLVSCGTILYPERRGQTGGRLDVGIVILDGIGLLFFLVPGLIAFGVDFTTGAIYLPEHKYIKKDPDNYRTVRFDPRHYTKESLENIIRQETGQDFHFNDQQIQYMELKNTDELSLHFKQYYSESGMTVADTVQ